MKFLTGNYIILIPVRGASSLPCLVSKPSSQNDSDHNFKEMKFRAGRVQSKPTTAGEKKRKLSPDYRRKKSSAPG